MEPVADLEARIIHEADGLIVVDKPAGWPTAGRDLDDPACIQALLMTRARRMIWAVHQLDADTTGVNVFVRRKALVAQVGQRMARHGLKRYLALVHGVPSFEQTRVDAPLGWVEGLWRRGVTPEGQSARSEVRVLSRGPSAALVEVQIHTGRTHQVRLHMAHLGHPLIGERRYREVPCEAMARHALHAHRLELTDAPALIFEAPIPEDLRQMAAALGIAWPA